MVERENKLKPSLSPHFVVFIIEHTPKPHHVHLPGNIWCAKDLSRENLTKLTRFALKSLVKRQNELKYSVSPQLGMPISELVTKPSQVYLPYIILRAHGLRM